MNINLCYTVVYNIRISSQGSKVKLFYYLAQQTNTQNELR